MLREVFLTMPAGMPANAYMIHEMVYTAMLGPKGDGHRAFLFSFEPEMGGVVTIRSECLPAPFLAASMPVRIPAAGAVEPFRLVASPTGRADDQHGRKRKDGRVRTRAVALPAGDKAARISWLAQKAVRSGFELVETPDVVSAGIPFERQGVSFRQERCVFTGSLKVLDYDRFVLAMTKGIGRARALGFGLLTTY